MINNRDVEKALSELEVSIIALRCKLQRGRFLVIVDIDEMRDKLHEMSQKIDELIKYYDDREVELANIKWVNTREELKK